MRTPQFIFSLGCIVLVVLVLTPQRHPLAYNTAAEVTLQGTVQDIQEFYCPVSGETGTHLTIATASGNVQVHIAPSRFLNTKKWEFSKGDKVEIIGAPILFQGRHALIARTIIRGADVVAVRQENGKPLWSE